MPATIMYRPSTRRVQYDNNNPTISTRNIQMSYSSASNKTKGIFVTLPGGMKFRRATTYERYTRSLSLGAGGYKEFTLNGGATHGVSVESAGGYYPDVFMSSLGPTIRSGIGSLSKFSGQPIIPNQMENEAATKALLPISDQKADIGENLATFRQTLQLIKSPAKELHSSLKLISEDQGIRRFLRRSYTDLKKEGVAKRISDQYLKYVYGVAPLVSDVNGVLEMMQIASGKTLLLSGKGRSQQECSPAMADVSASGTKTIFTDVHEKATVRCKIWGRIDPDCTGLRSLNQLGLLNPLSLAWELIPLSFVFDWFVPVGSVLEALTAPAGLIFVDGTTAVRNELTVQYEHWWTYSDATASVNNHAGGTGYYQGYSRKRVSSWPLPGIWANSNPFSGDRSLKALALAIKRLPHGVRI